MTKQTEALHKALKVLNCLNNDRVYETAWVKCAINACEEALAQPAQEPVAWRSEGGIVTESKLISQSWVEHGGKATPLYTHPQAPLQWQGLSMTEIYNIADNHGMVFHVWWEQYARAIEAKLKEKNTC